MQDVEIQSLLEEAGYRYLPATGRYVVLEEATDESEDFADRRTSQISWKFRLKICCGWEQEQQE